MMVYVFQFANFSYTNIYIMIFTYSVPKSSGTVATTAPVSSQSVRRTVLRPTSMFKIMSTKPTGCGSCGGGR